MILEAIHYTYIFAALAVFASFMRYGLYFKAIFKGEAKPHVFTWLNWSIITAISGVAQLQLGGGLSAYVLLLLAFTDIFVTICAFYKGEKDITRSDIMTFTSALMLIPVWIIVKDPFLVILLIISIDILGFYPTMRKSWLKPYDEPINSYVWAGMRYFFLLFSIADPTWQNLTFIVFLMLYKWSFVLFLMWRRQTLELKTES
jgi:hypothetical protein